MTPLSPSCTQFEALTFNPDIIVATPGRLMHHLLEVPHFSLSLVEVLVFDEADRLFEMGFADQLKEIMARVSPDRFAIMVCGLLVSVLLSCRRRRHRHRRRRC